jgi:hypothetical protein
MLLIQWAFLDNKNIINSTGRLCFNVTVGRICITIYHGKAISIIYSKCMSVAVVMQHTKHMCLIMLSSLGCLALQYFSTLSYKWHIFWKKVIAYKMWVFDALFYNFCLKQFLFYKELSEILL